MAATLYRTLTGQSQKSSHSKTAGLLTPSSTKERPELNLVPTSQTTFGVLNHLTEAQEQKLVEFKQQLQEDGWWSPDSMNGKPTHDDGTLLRYLRARKFDVPGAVGQFTDTEKWMKEQAVEDLYEHFDVDFFERARLVYPQWTGHRDRRGIPIYVYEIKGLDSKAVDNYQKESTAYKAKLPLHKNLSTPAKLLPLFALYHNLLNFVLPLCSSLERPRPEVPVTNSTNIVDISGVSLRMFWNLKAHMQDASVLATAHYPETLDRIFIIGAPAFFPTVWSWIKRWFDPVTVSKIFILGRNEVTPTLEKFMDPGSIPIKYGGKLDWNWGQAPDLDDEIRTALERDGNPGWVKGPALWLNNERIVVGSENGKLRRSEQEIAEKKPIVYAADYTEEPVHPEKRRSTINSSSGSTEVSPSENGITEKHVTEKPRAESPKAVQEEQLAEAGAAAAVAGAAVEASHNKSALPAPTQHLDPATIRSSPMGDSQVHLPNQQPAPPSTTAEYISPPVSPQQAPAKPTIVDAPEPEPVSAMVVSATNGAPHPPGHTQPGPLNQHTAELSKAIAANLQGESVVIIPETANGSLPHPEIISTSDATKGLAIEAEKLALARPAPERFVTAMEVPQKS